MESQRLKKSFLCFLIMKFLLVVEIYIKMQTKKFFTIELASIISKMKLRSEKSVSLFLQATKSRLRSRFELLLSDNRFAGKLTRKN